MTKFHTHITLNRWILNWRLQFVIGKAGINIKPENAHEHIFGYTIFNDWSARDVQRAETKIELGPAKGKDFASSLGPVIVTLELTKTQDPWLKIGDVVELEIERIGVLKNIIGGKI